VLGDLRHPHPLKPVGDVPAHRHARRRHWPGLFAGALHGRRLGYSCFDPRVYLEEIDIDPSRWFEARAAGTEPADTRTPIPAPVHKLVFILAERTAPAFSDEWLVSV
jgi:hypothetical protein